MTSTTTRRTVVPRRAYAGALLLAIALTACTPSTPATPGDDDRFDGGGTLVYATGDAEPTCLDPHVGGNFPQALLSSQVLEPLVGRDADGTITPWLATAWTVDPDGLTWEFTLAERTFTDGTPFDADAVKASIEHLQDPNTGSSTGYLAVASIASVEVVEPQLVRFHLSRPDAALLESLAQPWTAIQSPTALARGMEANCLAPIGTGPFMVADWTPQQQVDLVANPDYIRPDGEARPPALDGITWRFIPDAATRFAALQSGEVQVIDNPQPDAIVQSATLAFTHLDAPRPGSANRIELNSGQPPFDDVRVREAFIRAADPGPGIETLFAGVSERSFSLLSSVEPTAVSDPDLFVTDAEQAGELLDQAGWTQLDADGVRLKDGQRLTVRFPVSTNQSVAAEQSLFEQIQANAKAVGFDVILQPMDLGAWYTALGENAYEAVSAPYTKIGPDVLRILYHSASTVPAPSGYFANHAFVRDPAIDALLDTAASALNEDDRLEAVTQAQQLILSGFYVLPLYDQQNHFLVNGAQGVTTLTTVSTPSFVDATLS